MPSAEDIKQRIEAAIPGAHAEVEDYTGGGDHFRATVTARGVRRASAASQQHRLVYAVFGAEIGGAIHALALKTQTPVADPSPLRARSTPCPASQFEPLPMSSSDARPRARAAGAEAEPDPRRDRARRSPSTR